MNAPTPPSADRAATHTAAHAASHAANPAVAHSARLEDGGRAIVAWLATSSIDKLDGLIAELKEMREVLRLEGERVQREVGQYAQLAQTALAVTQAVTGTVPPAGSTDAAAQNAAAKPLAGGREKLKRWPPPAD